MTSEQQQHFALWDMLYNAALNPRIVADNLADIVRFCSVDKAAVQIEDMRQQHVRPGGGYYGYHADELASYLQYYSQYEPWTPLLVKHYGEEFRFVSSDQLMSLSQYQQSEFYHDWAKPLNIGRSATCAFNIGNHKSFKFCLKQSAARAFTRQQFLRINALFPHLRNLATLASIFHKLPHSGVTIEKAINNAKNPVFLLNAQCQVLSQNLQAHQIAQQSNGLHIKQSKLGLNNTTTDTQLKKTVFNLCQHIDIVSPVPARSQTTIYFDNHQYACHPTNSTLSKAIYLLALPSVLTGIPIVLAYLSVPSPGTSKLTKQYALSEKEAALCALLVQGHTLEEATQAQHQSMHASRKQLKRVFLKLGVSSQTELVNLLLN